MYLFCPSNSASISPQTPFVSSPHPLDLLVTVLTLIGVFYFSFVILAGEKVHSHRICLIASYILHATSSLALSFITQTWHAQQGAVNETSIINLYLPKCWL